MLGSFQWGDFNTNMEREIDKSIQAGIIFMKTPIKIKDVQSLVFYGAPNQHTTMTTGIGVSVELYNDTNDKALNNSSNRFSTTNNRTGSLQIRIPKF